MQATGGGGPSEPKITYNYLWTQEGNVDCFKSKEDRQTVTKLWEVSELADFHDQELAQATKQINAILRRVEKDNKDPKRKLSFIKFQNRHLLVWAEYGAVGPDDHPRTIRKALKLKK